MDEWEPPRLSIRVPWDAELQRRLSEKLFGALDVDKGFRGHLGKPPRAVAHLGGGAAWLSSRPAIFALGVLIVAGAAAIGWSWRGSTAPDPVVPVASTAGTSLPAPEGGREIWFRDGSLALLQRPESDLRVDVADVHSISATLIAGRARFDVVPRPERLFRIKAGDVVIEVLGTAFSVERRGVSSLVTVTRGRVRVSWPGGARELAAGSEGVFPPPGEPLAGASAVANAGAAVILAEHASPRPVTSPEEAPPAAPAGQTAPTDPPSLPDGTARPRSQPPLVPAPARLPAPRLTDPPASPTNSSDLLLGQADLARIAGRPEEAVELLRRLLRQSAGDGRAPLAAFTLGRILSDELHAPGEAAEAFAQARDLAPGGPLVEDTYLREVEAYVHAGLPARATERAEEYLSRFSGSPRVPLMRRLIAPLN